MAKATVGQARVSGWSMCCTQQTFVQTVYYPDWVDMEQKVCCYQTTLTSTRFITSLPIIKNFLEMSQELVQR